MKTTVVCGVLGSGKTSFIRNVVSRSAEKTVVLVNDFGSAGIDGEIISSGGIETVELPSGCVCCSLRFDLIRTLEKVIGQFHPEHLYIEPSGVASPSGVLEVLDTLKIRNVSVVGIVDATDFIEAYEEEMYGWFFKNQVARSDVILVNKTDLVDEAVKESTVTLIGEINPNALVLCTVHAVMDPELIRHEEKEGLSESGHGHVLRYDTVTVQFPGPVSLRNLEAEFTKLARGAYGRVVRAKALVETNEGPYRFDLSSGKIDCVRFERPVETGRLVIIGTDLAEDTIRLIPG